MKSSHVLTQDISQVLLYRFRTDSPYLTPVPFRGKMNEPKNTYYTLEMMASLHNKTLEEMADITYKNSLKVFKLYEKN